MATSVSEYVDYEEKDGVGIWKIEDFPAAIEAGDMKAAEQHYVETASDPEMQSVVVTIGGVENMDSEVLEHVEEEWTAVAAESGVDFTASLLRRRLLILLSRSCGVEEDKGTASAVPDTNDSARCVWVGIGRSGPAGTGSLA